MSETKNWSPSEPFVCEKLEFIGKSDQSFVILQSHQNNNAETLNNKRIRRYNYEDQYRPVTDQKSSP